MHWKKLTRIRRELQERVILTSILTTQLEIMLTSKDDLLINSFGIRHRYKIICAALFSETFKSRYKMTGYFENKTANNFEADP